MTADPDARAGAWQQADSLASYYAAIAEIGRRVKAGAAVPQCLRSTREEGGK